MTHRLLFALVTCIATTHATSLRIALTGKVSETAAREPAARHWTLAQPPLQD
jgi:hypothetical protein